MVLDTRAEQRPATPLYRHGSMVWNQDQFGTKRRAR